MNVNISERMPGEQCGATLIITLLMLVVVLLLGIAAARIALQGEKAARNDRDRQIAFQAAEATLLDAEMDIEASPNADRSRSNLFHRDSVEGFPLEGNACGSGIKNRFLGLCRHASAPAQHVWQTVDFMNSTSTASSIPYGQFTGQVFPTGGGSLPALAPRYIIELIPDRKMGERADKTGYLYRITAIGFGTHETTQVALQSIYRKANQ